MNWSRGLFRLWIALSCVWIAAVTGDTYNDWQQKIIVDNPLTWPREMVLDYIHLGVLPPL
jgi:hypothetical protein